MNSEDVQKFVKDGILTWTMTTNYYKFYTLNMITSLKEVAKVPWTLCVICCDDESFLFFRREGIPCIAWKRGGQKGQKAIAAFGTQEFMKWNRMKIDILQWFCQNALAAKAEKTLYVDGDIVFQRDPWPVLKEEFASSEKPLLFQCDCANDTEHESEGCGNICSGVIATLHTKFDNGKLYEIDEALWKEVDKQDQPYIGKGLVRLGIPYKTLGRRLFGNGHWQKSLKWKDDPTWILLHYNFRVGDTKKQAMRSYGHWRIPY